MSRFALVLFFTLPLCAQNYSAPRPVPATPTRTSGPVCPWLSQGTAAAALAGDVHTSVTGTGAAEGSCSFVREQAPQDELHIFVASTAAPACPAGSSKVNAIGTRAARCHAGEGKEIISGAVRDKTFAVVMTSKAKPAVAKADALEMVAEQVAGSLF